MSYQLSCMSLQKYNEEQQFTPFAKSYTHHFRSELNIEIRFTVTKMVTESTSVTKCPQHATDNVTEKLTAPLSPCVRYGAERTFCSNILAPQTGHIQPLTLGFPFQKAPRHGKRPSSGR